jgi:hypothetical protein
VGIEESGLFVTGGTVAQQFHDEIGLSGWELRTSVVS